MRPVRGVRTSDDQFDLPRLKATILAALTAGHLAPARTLTADALATATDPIFRAEAARLHARLTMWSGPLALSTWQQLVSSADEVQAEDPELAARLLCDAAVIAAYVRQLDQAELLASRALSLSNGEGLVGALAATDLGIAYGLTGRTEAAAPLLERAGDLADAVVGLVEQAELLEHITLALVVQERYDDAADVTVRFLHAARPLAATGLLPLPLCLLAQESWKAGNWERARLAASDALALAQGSGETTPGLYAPAFLALVAGGQGRDAACRELVERARFLSDTTGVGNFRVTAEMALVQLALGHGHPADAEEPLRTVTQLMGG